jgi:UDP-N-acetylglucosamine 4,6-dehydratase
MAPDLPIKIIGIRPGEKLHELMISRDDSPITLEFPDHYVITPSIRFVSGSNYEKNGRNETGKPVGEGFKYASDSNPVFLSVPEIAALSRQTA